MELEQWFSQQQQQDEYEHQFVRRLRYTLSMVNDFDIWRSYYDCCSRKNTSAACVEYKINEMVYIPRLVDDLNNGTYEIGYSNAFVVTTPKYREVFAADFRDRIVHHYLMLKTLHLFEEKFIDDTYSCRVGKGVTYGVSRISEKMSSMGPCWVLKCDISGFFMHISKQILAEKLDAFLKEKYHEEDAEFIRNLTKQVVLHNPQDKCRRKGDVTLWKYISDEKSLFTNERGLGLPIGNLTSQIYANFYMSFFDDWVLSHDGIEYGRYVDDFIIMCKDKKKLLKLLEDAKKFLWNELRLTISDTKISLQHSSKGVEFTGYKIYGDVILPGKRLKANVKKLIYQYNERATSRKAIESFIEEFANRYNSYMGFLTFTRSFKLRKELWESLDFRFKEFITINKEYSKITVRKEYKSKYKKIYELRRIAHYERKLRRLHEDEQNAMDGKTNTKRGRRRRWVYHCTGDPSLRSRAIARRYSYNTNFHPFRVQGKTYRCFYKKNRGVRFVRQCERLPDKWKARMAE